MIFINQDHKSKFFKLIKKDQVLEQDVKRISLFYILSANEELYNKVHNIYDFQDHTIQTDALENRSLSSVAQNILKLGFKLFNGSCREYKDVSHLFSKLDVENFEICMYAVRILLGNIEIELID